MHSLKSMKLWKSCCIGGLAFIGVFSAVLTIAGFSVYSIFYNVTWIGRLGIVCLLYLFVVIITVCIKLRQLNIGFSTVINGISVSIKVGDIFSVSGCKVIPFTEYYNTEVDNVIINESSLNGQLVTKVKKERRMSALLDAIANERSSPLSYEDVAGKTKYQLGYIKRFDDFLLLSFAHFNEQNEANMTWAEYESCLRTMWGEICRTYSDLPIYVPLLGSGVTRIRGRTEKSNADLLKCILCTFRSSDIQLNKPVTILLTKETMQNINLHDVKGFL